MNGRRNIERRSSDRDLNSPLVCEFRRVRAESEAGAGRTLEQLLADDGAGDDREDGDAS